VIGLLERIKYNLIEGAPIEEEKENKPINTKQKYDA
jgi:hypothetical protein